MSCYKSCVVIGFFALLIGCANPDFEDHHPNVTCEQCYNIMSIEQLLTRSLKQYQPHEILVVFDFNYTLMYPQEPCLHKNNIKLHEHIFKNILKQISHAEADAFLAEVKNTKNQVLISKDLPAFLKKYEDINFLVCSGAWIHNAETYSNLLSTNGVRIRNHYGLSEFEFSEFTSYGNRHPIYKNGLILTNKGEKGPILKSFLNRLSQKPKLIIFVDNSPKKLDSIKELANTLRDIKFVIIKYSEYKTKDMPTVSAETFRKYWQNQLQLFKQRRQHF